MSSWEKGIGFRAVGSVVRVFVPPSGKCAFLTLAIPGKRREEKHDFRTFDDEMIVEVGALVPGQIVQITGSIDSEALKDKAKKDVTVDGRACWVEKLTIKALTVEGSSKRPAPKRDVPFGGPEQDQPREAPAPSTDWDDNAEPDF